MSMSARNPRRARPTVAWMEWIGLGGAGAAAACGGDLQADLLMRDRYERTDESPVSLTA